MFANYRRLSRNTIVLATTIGLALSSLFSWNPILALHLRSLGANELEIGLAFSLLAFAHAVPAFFGGILADHVGRKWIVVAPGLLLAPLYILAGFASEWHIVTALLAAASVLGSLQWPAMQALISESDEQNRAMAFSLIEIFVITASTVGPLLGSLFLPTVGVGGLLAVNGLIMIIVSLIRAVGLKETHPDHPRSRQSRLTFNLAIPQEARWIIMASFLFMLAMGLTLGGPFVAILGHDKWSLTDEQIQQMTSIGALASFVGIWLGGRSDAWGGRRVWRMAAIGFAVSLAGWGLAPDIRTGIVFVLGANLFSEALFIVQETLLAHHTEPATRSSLFGLSASASGLSGSIGPSIGAGLVSFSNLQAPFLAGAFVSLVSFFVISPVRDIRNKEGILVSPGE